MMKGEMEMLTRLNATAVLSGVAASLLFAVSANAASQDNPVVVKAEPLEGVRSERVPYADLNLAQRRDVYRLRQRVGSAVKRVCLFEDGRSALLDTGYARCSNEAWDGADPQIALAVTRAKEIALTGHSAIPASPIAISVVAR